MTETKSKWKEVFTAYYDPKTDKIKNCKKGSTVWHHENRHRQQFKHPEIKKANTILSQLVKNFLYIAVIGWMIPELGFFLTMAMGIFITWIAFESYLEIDAIIYQFKMSGKNGKNKRRTK